MADDPQHSKDLNVSEAAERIASLESAEAVRDFTSGDDRKGVSEAADARMAELAQSPETQAGAIRLTGDDDERAKPGKPLATGGSGNVTVRTRYPVDRFEHGLDGVPIITGTGVELDRSKAGKLVELAEANGVELEEVGA